VLGSGSMVAGFEAGIAGMQAGDKKAIHVIFPADYRDDNLAGKEVVFNVTTNRVSEALLPELDNEFFAKFGPKIEDIEGFKVQLRVNMEREMAQALRVKRNHSVLNAYLALHKFDVPQALVKEELDRLKQQALNKFGGNGNLNSDTLPDTIFQNQALKRVKASLLMHEIVKHNAIQVDQGKVKVLIDEMAQSYEDPQEFIDYHTGDVERRNQLERVVLEQQVVEHLIAAATVTDVDVDYKTAIKPAAQDDV
jgi:trigger factor